jgi:DNA repair protein RecN (Recombination protein N)
MITKLLVRNFALIDEVEVNFSSGFTTITGETGAGKSILLGALSLLLGNRADLTQIGNPEEKCLVEGTFNISGYHLERFFSDNELDFEENTIIRREISREGKSRAFINDTPVNLSILRDFTSKLVDIHSQHQTLTIQNSEFQMSVLDGYSDDSGTLASYKLNFREYQELARELKELRESESKSRSEMDYFQFLFQELSEANLRSGEQEELENELTLLNNAESIKGQFSAIHQAFEGSDSNLLSELKMVISGLSSVMKNYPPASELHQRAQSATEELKDISETIATIADKIVFDPERFQIVSDRIDLIYRLQQKHRVSTMDELIRERQNLEVKLNSIQNMSQQISLLENRLIAVSSQLEDLAGKIHQLRKKAAKKIEKDVTLILHDLGMKNARIEISVESLPKGTFRENGGDLVQFLFSANKGSEPKELGVVASGGELSRLMLAIKSLLAKQAGLSTIIFDEIDTGISGEVSHKVANIIRSISRDRQVVAITHLPQMAGKGDDHLMVYKETTSKQTKTRIKRLSDNERVAEIAKMLSGDNPSKAAMENARELLAV